MGRSILRAEGGLGQESPEAQGTDGSQRVGRGTGLPDKTQGFNSVRMKIKTTRALSVSASQTPRERYYAGIVRHSPGAQI